MKAFKMLLQDPETLARLLKTPRNRREAKNLYQLAKDWAMSKGFVFSRRAYVAGQEPGEDGFEAQEAAQPQAAPFVLTPEEQALSEQDARRLLEEDKRMAAPPNEAPVSVLNNNPGNLVMAGQPGAIEGERGFAAFETPRAGLQALRRQVALDTQDRGMTLRQFMNKYAPPSENDTENYLAFISQNTGLDPDKRVPSNKISDLMRAIVRMEGGQTAIDYFYGTRMAEGESGPRPMAQVSMPQVPMPTPQAAPAPAAPAPQQRAQYAALFPEDPVSGLIQSGGIASLAS